MKRIFFIIVVTLLAARCQAQWISLGGNAQVVAFGVHDTSFFFSEDHHMSRANPTGEADAGLDFTQGNFTTFASAGPNFFAGSYNPAIGGGVGALSTNNGSSWKTVIGGPVGTNGTYVFANYAYNIARSTDNGNTWHHLSYPAGMNYVGTGAVVFTSTISYWAGTSSAGFWRSSDSGYTWTKLSPPPFLGTLMTMGTLLFMYQPYYYYTPPPYNGVLLLSRDSGQDWDTVRVDSAGIPELVTALATDGTNLFAGGANGNNPEVSNGVYVSTDTGKTWRAVNDGLSNLDITAFGVYDSNLYAAGGYSFPYYAADYRPLREMVDSTTSGVQEAALLGDTIEIYPNPASGLVSIRSGGASILGAQVLNVLGTEVQTLPNLRASFMSIDLSKLPSGTYFLEIETARGTVLRKVIRE